MPNVSNALRAEFARGDGRVKRKEDDRRRGIQPSDTLFVVNFHEETTKREDLQMLFEPFGELVRIDSKSMRNDCCFDIARGYSLFTLRLTYTYYSETQLRLCPVSHY